VQVITLKDNPKIAAIVRSISRKHKAFLIRQDYVSLDGTAWDGGSRSSYYLVNLTTCRAEALPHSAPVQFGAAGPVPKYIAPGYAIVEAGTFQGKPATPTVYLRNDHIL
jgi:hypothetical protein